MKFTLIKQQHNTGRLLYRVTETGSFIPYSTGIGRVITRHVLYSGTRLKKKIVMCLFRFLFYVKTEGLWALIAFCVTPFQPLNHCSMLCDLSSNSYPIQRAVWPLFNLLSNTSCYVTSLQPLIQYSMLCDLSSISKLQQHTVWLLFSLWSNTAYCVTFQTLNHYSMLCDLSSSSDPIQHGVWSFNLCCALLIILLWLKLWLTIVINLVVKMTLC
jgi:hypothetical protein